MSNKRRDLLRSLNRTRNRLVKKGARNSELKQALGFSVEKLGDMSTSQLEKYYRKSKAYGDLTVVDGGVVPTEYVKRARASKEFSLKGKYGAKGYNDLKKQGKLPRTPLYNVFKSAINSSMMKNYTSKANMINQKRKQAEETQKGYAEALKRLGLYEEARKIMMMPRFVFNEYLSKVGYRGTFRVVYYAAQQLEEGVPMDELGIDSMRYAVKNCQVMRDFKPNF